MDIDPKLRSSGNNAANGASVTTPSTNAADQNATSSNTQGGRGTINAPSPGSQHQPPQLQAHPHYHPNSQTHLPSGQPDHSSQLRSATVSQTNSPAQSQLQYQLQTPHNRPDSKASVTSQATAHNPPSFSSIPPQSPTSSVDYSHDSSAAPGTATAHDTPADVPSPGVDGGERGPNGEPKKPRACESCRGLKVRCEPNPANPNGDCKRCAKAKRPCVITEPSRKRQKKADNRVAELEKKIDALTATLQNVRGGTNPLPLASPSVSPATTGPDAQAVPRYTTATPYDPNNGYGSGRGTSISQPPSATRDWPGPPREQQPASGRQQTPSRAWPGYGEMDRDNNPYPTPTMAPGGLKRKHGADDRERASQDPRDNNFSIPRLPARQPDIVDRNVISMAQASAFFERYNKHMVPHLPGVVFPADMTADELRRSHPILFHAVMAAAAGEIPSVQKILTNELMKRFAEEVMVTGNKSLELVQAIQVATIWYWPPERFEELKFYQLLHIAAVMAIDLGLGRKRQPRGGLRNGMPTTIRDKIMYKPPPPDPTSIESRRAWLTCYFLATNTSMALHRPNLIRWSSFMEESVSILETSPEAAPTDKYLCHLIWTHRLAEEVGINFFDDHNSGSSITIPRTQHLLSYFEHKLDEYQRSLPDDMRQPSLMLSFHVLDLYMHEIVWQNESPDDVKGPNTSIDGQTAWLDGNLTPAHVKALSATLEAIKHIFEIFLNMEIHSIRCLPAFSFVRIAYAVVILIRIHLSVISPKTELGKVMKKEDIEVEKWIEKLLEKFKVTMAEDKNRPAAKFFFVLGMLRQWFQAQKQPARPKGSSTSRTEAGPSGAAASGTSTESSTTPSFGSNQTPRKDNAGDKNLATTASGTLRSNQAHKQQQQQQPNASNYPTTADTPLHLLSEVATHESSTVPTSSSSSGPAPPPPPGGKPTVTTGPGPSPSQHTAHMPNNANIILSAPISASPNDASVAWNLHRSQQPAQHSPFNMSGASPATTVPDMNQQALGSQDPLPWFSQAFMPEFEPVNFGDGFEQAMDLTLGGVVGDEFDVMALGMGLGMGMGMGGEMDMGGGAGGGFDGGLGAAGFGGGGREVYSYGQGWYGGDQQQQQNDRSQTGGGGGGGAGAGHGQQGQQQQQQQHAGHGGHGGHHHAGGMNPNMGYY
ncbi:hypothetical protein SMACR_05948 [Sordaria macrospora]|uniref:Zn(2)-C6 fungal-type domain-containing protein n=1 Tax=Sordaria macrospora TaxID=5147 RepID=A0A8S8ZUP3_SORMA|nr:hypothetical protein SMACR_05948 [Sordaria macrospora]KAH7626671.1 hypothetical protein B0T09DRAFT_292952 [Sordaria sp. MPI-SDFR-AT-0083]WPJ57782.1 hypothetical protein SMAC4_05948 [Sordaria macrospora]